MASTNISPEVEARAFQEYFLRLGEFNNAFTGMEHMLTCAIKNTLSREMKDDRNEWLINAIVGSMRMSPAKDTVKRILRVQAVDQKKINLLDKAFAHLGEIEWLRNRLAHNRTGLHGTDNNHMFVNYDFASAKEVSKSQFIGFHALHIRAASEDLVAITRLTDDVFSMIHGLMTEGDLKLPTWHYKPSMLIRHRPKFVESQKQPTRPPQS